MLGAGLIAVLAAAVIAPPANAPFDYQLGGDYPPPAGTAIVTRDWAAGQRPAGAYGICYVNAFQTQAEGPPRWPAGLVLRRIGDDPGWPGEYLVDLSRASTRRRAAAVAGRMLARCAAKGFAAVELDNLDSWTRLAHVPFGRRRALAYARLLTGRAHALGLAAAQKNTPQLTRAQAHGAGFDFAVSEECARYDECGRYRALYGDRVLDVEYRRGDFDRACQTVGARISVVLRDRNVVAHGRPGYRYAAC